MGFRFLFRLFRLSRPLLRLPAGLFVNRINKNDIFSNLISGLSQQCQPSRPSNNCEQIGVVSRRVGRCQEGPAAGRLWGSPFAPRSGGAWSQVGVQAPGGAARPAIVGELAKRVPGRVGRRQIFTPPAVSVREARAAEVGAGAARRFDGCFMRRGLPFRPTPGRRWK